jgi:hypothetical protein
MSLALEEWWGWPTLPSELCDVIMLLAHEDSEVSGTFLGNTCKQECDRYRRLIPEDEQVTYRDFKVGVAYAEGTARHRKRGPDWTSKGSPGYLLDYFGRGDPAIPGDRDYAYCHRMEVESFRKIERDDWIRPNARRAKAAKARELRYSKAQWKRGRDVDGEFL